MKRILAVVLSAVILLGTVACSKSDLPPESSTGAQVSTQESSSDMNSKQEVSSEVKCEHEYKPYAHSGSCTYGRQVVNYKCTKCSHKYKKSYDSAQHVYDDYVCIYCYLVSPDNSEKGLKKWVEKNGEKRGNSYLYTSKNETTNEEFIIRTHRYGEEWCKITYERYIDPSLYIVGDFMLITFYENGECEIYWLGFGDSVLSKKTTKQEFNKFLKQFPGLKKIMLKIQEDFLLPHMGVRFDQMGFPI